MRILGVKRSKGVYRPEGTKDEWPYDNWVFICADKEKNVVGEGVSMHKIPAERFTDLFGIEASLELFATMVGENVVIYYDNKNKVIRVEFCQPATENKSKK